MKGKGICLLSRRELKFVAAPWDVPILISFLAGKKFKFEEPTRIWNLVFDRKNRKNFENYARARLRIYYKTQIALPCKAYLEKRKSLWGKVTKERVAVWFDGFSYIGIDKKTELLCNWIHKSKLKPIVVVDYERRALYRGKNRVTFDSDIEYLAYSDKKFLGKTIGREENCVVKIKWAGERPFWIPDFVAQRKEYIPKFSKVENAFKAMKEAKKQ